MEKGHGKMHLGRRTIVKRTVYLNFNDVSKNLSEDKIIFIEICLLVVSIKC